MNYQNERRRNNRFPASGSVYVIGETESGPFELRGRLENVCAAGLGLSLGERLAPGTVVWCAAPAHSLYERGQVCHSGGSLLRRRSTGIRFLAAPAKAD